MRQIPIDTTKITLISSGKAAARAAYAELSDGTRKRIPGEQAKDTDSGMPLWVIDVIVDDPDSDRAEVVGVRVASWDEPVTAKFQPVRFTDLVCVPYVDGRTNRVALSFRASGVENTPAAATKAA